MWRGNLSQDDIRIKNFLKDRLKIKRLFNSLLKKNNKWYIRFSYTEKFLLKSISSNIFNGACVYLNPVEKEYKKLIHRFKKFKFIIIRPFGGRLKLAKKHKLNFLLNYSHEL